MPTDPQTFANHTRLHPMYHFFLLPITGINLVWSIIDAVRTPTAHSFWSVIMAIAFMLLVLIARGYALKVQDRVIRLEERLRMRELLPPDLAARIPELRARQLIALRFCSDAELPDLVRGVLDEGIVDPGEIKKRIKVWRGDVFRV